MLQFYEAISDDFQLPRAWHSRNNAFLPHFHESIELLYVKNGLSTAIIDGSHLSAGAGELIITGSYQVHSYIEQDNQTIIATIPLAAVPSLSALLAARGFAAPIFADETETLRPMLEMMVSLMDCPHALCGMAAAVLGFLIDRVGLLQTSRSAEDDLPRKILKYLGEHYHKPISSAALAAHFGYSRSRLSHVFKSTTGYSLPEYLHMLRLRRAATLLESTTLPVGDVAQQCGYTSLHTFHYAFRDHMGTTPGEYRRAQTSAG